MIEKRFAQKLDDFESNDFECLGVDEIRLCEYGYSPLNAKQTADIEVLASLRLDAFVSGNHQKNQIDSADSGEHIAYEFFMPRNVHESEPKHFAIRFGKFQMREAKINRYSTALFFGETVGVNAGKCLNQSGFPVIDMPGRADDDGFHLVET